ncbi:hypothetical protein ABFS82_07G019100 [Erythranthe guttata]|uniref:Glycosyltransferase n=1 Tax=Erythranthe guttata TaxID=4155 RepID=A0A022RV77_ERYGU|nr:PREDICTED: beta-D-glucosyl crocetin beta-1,6-glucosyltransferase-like [Erythranthe guttata]EYU43901.1 hypothetical protein MIMGU_mgv1a020989mg [Erythranthe guttata]|eukprot:XP_012858792.1 PREDICTED: beta-D-glucosyl crocetin beta-1,6-glucosyltransferase-like [Erythranthe guttata]
MEKDETKFTILMFPWLAYSHVFPFFELAKSLSKRRTFHIYFCSSAANLGSIENNLNNHKLRCNDDDDVSIDLVELQLPPSPQLPPHFHTTKNLPPNLVPILLQTFQESSSSFSRILIDLKPDLLIYDFFQPWAAKQALSLSIPSIYFATAGAAPFSYFHHLHTHGSASTFPYQEIYLSDREKADLNAVVAPEIKDADQDFAFGNFKLSCDIVLIKSSKGLEQKYIDYLSVLCRKKVVPTGPLVQESNIKDDDDDESEVIMQWLSEKDRFSTVLICFGSEHLLPKEQIVEIAKGLEQCCTNFIWIVRFIMDENALRLEDELPEGFLERVEGRGLVVQKWAPQAKILSHPSIGGFVSHCGWSSIMESLYFGVPIIALPIKFDQPINGRLVVEAGCGVEIGRGENGICSAEEVAKAIKKVIMEDSGEGLIRYNARNLGEKMKTEKEIAANEVAEELLLICKKSKQHADKI